MKDIFIVVFRNLKEIINIVSLLKNLPEILSYLLVNGKEDKEIKVNEESVTQEKLRIMILNKLKTLWNEAKKWPWKDQLVFIEVIPEMSKFFDVDSYNGYFMDSLLEALKFSNKISKHKIMNSICKLLTTNHHLDKRVQTFKLLIQLSRSTSYCDRENYLIFCGAALNYFSLSLFKEYEIIDQYFGLMEDKVFNIRLKAINIAIPLWRFAGDPYREEIREKLDNLRNDKSKEVRQYADSALSLLQLNGANYMKEDTLIAERNALREAAERGLEKKEEQEKEEQKKPKEKTSEENPKTIRKAHTINSAVKSSFSKASKDIKSPQKRGPSGRLSSVVTKGKKIKSFIDKKTPQIGKNTRKISDPDSNLKSHTTHKKSK